MEVGIHFFQIIFASTCESLILHLKLQYYKREEVVSGLSSVTTTQGPIAAQ